MSAKTTLILASILIVFCFAIAVGQTMGDYSMVPIDHPAIQYTDGPVQDPVAKLNARLESGKASLEFQQDGLGYLLSVLKNLGVNTDSQMLVFSKTSFQAAKISPKNPRALFFSDDVMVGNVRGGDVLEFASLDPKQGYIFYSLDIGKSDKPRFIRRDSCLQCHQIPASLGVPGVMVTSVFPDATGMPNSRAGNPVTDQRTPIQERWGGWYVTGMHGGMSHRGNAVAIDSGHPNVLETRGTQNVTSLAKKFDAAGYLSQMSDIVALMTLEHQTRMTNLMIRAGWDARIAQQEGKTGDAATKTRLDSDIQEIVDYMLFVNEARLYDQIEGTSTFTKTFPERGPRDKQGRSLRDFDLETRMFRYPLSYMIYSDVFDALPDTIRDPVYQRLFDVLTGKDRSQKFARLSDQDRANILAILRDTKTGLPGYWRAT
jgi:hypothetical protein